MELSAFVTFEIRFYRSTCRIRSIVGGRATIRINHRYCWKDQAGDLRCKRGPNLFVDKTKYTDFSKPFYSRHLSQQKNLFLIHRTICLFSLSFFECHRGLLCGVLSLVSVSQFSFVPSFIERVFRAIKSVSRCLRAPRLSDRRHAPFGRPS